MSSVVNQSPERQILLLKLPGKCTVNGFMSGELWKLDKAEFKLLKYIRNKFINSNFQCLQVRNPQDIWRFLAGTVKPSGHHFPLQGEANASVREGKNMYF